VSSQGQAPLSGQEKVLVLKSYYSRTMPQPFGASYLAMSELVSELVLLQIWS